MTADIKFFFLLVSIFFRIRSLSHHQTMYGNLKFKLIGELDFQTLTRKDQHLLNAI